MSTLHPILVVDDDEDIREVMAMALSAVGHDVATAADGLEALQLVNGGLRPALVLLDMMMPRMDGEGFLVSVRRTPAIADIPVVVLSGHRAARQKADDLRADGCLVKPIELDELLGAVNRFAIKEG